MQFYFKGQMGAAGESGRNGYKGKDGEYYVDQSDGQRKQRKGENGTDGTKGWDGSAGGKGFDVGVTIGSNGDEMGIDINGEFHELIEQVTIDASGGPGGNGGNGGRGGMGGSGNPPGMKGSDGPGGNGGRGGTGGNISIMAEDPVLLNLVHPISDGGRGGSGGIGNPSGYPGKKGEEGNIDVTVVYKGKKFTDSGFGLTTSTINYDTDGTVFSDLFTRGSKFDINGLRIENRYNIPIPGPFDITCVSENDALTFNNFRLTNDEVGFDPKSFHEFEVSFDGQISENAPIGYYPFRIALHTKRAGMTIVLNSRMSVNNNYSFAVNHRLDMAGKVYEELENEQFDDMIVYFNSLPPDVQFTAFTILLLFPILSQKQTPDGSRELEDFNQLLHALEDNLFSFDLHEQMMDEGDILDIAKASIGFDLEAAADFFKWFDKNVIYKLLDNLYFAATIGDKIEKEHKEYILKFSEMVLGDTEWLKSKYERLFQKGSSKVGATSSNKLASWVFPVLPHIAMVVFVLLNTDINDAFMYSLWNLDTFLREPIANTRTYFLMLAGLYLLLTWISRKLLFRKSCPRCNSLLLQPLADDEQDAKITHRCLDCGSRVSKYADSEFSAKNIDCRETKGKKSLFERIPFIKQVILILNIIFFIIFPAGSIYLWLTNLISSFHRKYNFRKGAIVATITAIILIVGWEFLSRTVIS